MRKCIRFLSQISSIAGNSNILLLPCFLLLLSTLNMSCEDADWGEFRLDTDLMWAVSSERMGDG